MNTNEKICNLKNKSDYSANESQGGHCPKCGNDEIEYGSSEIEGDYVEYEWECKKCGSEGVEFGAISFDGYRVDSSPFMDNEDSESCETFNDVEK
jgi:predicted nucleic-acid-binding Zn-ribbon protein